MVRVKRGDWLLPSNDGRTLLRLATYREDGSLEVWGGDRYRVVRGTYWGVWRYRKPLDAFAGYDLGLDDDWLDDWNEWELIESLLPTRAAAIAAVLNG